MLGSAPTDTLAPVAARGALATRRYGFTILELVVTISIIVVLTALLLTSVQRVIDAQEKLSCAVAMRSLGQGVAQFAIDHNQVLPEHHEGAAPKFEHVAMRDNKGDAVNLGQLLGYVPDARHYYCPTLEEELSPATAMDSAFNPWNDGAGGPDQLRSSFAVRTRRYAGGTLPRWTMPNHHNKVIYTDFVGVDDKPAGGPFGSPVDAPHESEGVNRLFGDGAVLWADITPLQQLRPIDDKIPTPKQMSDYFDLLDLIP